MKISIQSIDCSPRQELLDLVNEKFTKLTHFSDRILETKIILRVEKSEKRDNKTVEARLVIPGDDLFVKKHSESFEESLQKVYEVLQREIKDWKEKNNQS
jgi:putative sigma-54 modulation protein